MKKITFLILFFALITNGIFAQTNANCSGAIALAPGEEATGSANSGSHSGIFASCGPNANDYWYSFIAPASGEVTLTSNDNYAVYTDCTGNTQVFCGNGTNLIQSLTQGSTYYVQVNPFPIACKGAACGDFTIMATGNVLSNKTLLKNQFKIFPNPVKDILNVNADHEITSIQLYDILGKEILNRVTNKFELKINLSDFKRGHYILRVHSVNATKVIKVFKQ